MTILMILAFGQTDSTKQPIQIDFLATYYQQDGNHSAVTGGIGTEELQDYTSQLIVNIPLDSSASVGANIQANYYSSASTDNINIKTSSASSEDIRLQIGLNYQKTEGNQSKGLNVSMSSESDYLAYGLGFYYQYSWANDNRFIKLQSQFYHGKWAMYFPDELRNTTKASLPHNIRNSYNASLTYGGVINRRAKAAITFAPSLQTGILSTPFHRIYYTNEEVDIERLPEKRWQYPIALQFNYFSFDFLIHKINYRYYIDEWGLEAQSLKWQGIIKWSPYFKCKPFVRYHVQSAATYFKPYGQHHLGDQWRTSDFDLSAFESWKYGLGLEWKPLNPIFKNKTFKWEQLSLQSSIYNRSDGLAAWAMIFNFSFSTF